MARARRKEAAPIWSAEPFVPDTGSLSSLAEAARSCRGCDLFRNATQAVFGEGKARARIVLVGEQPGDQEDRQGRPFVGPAGRLLDRALNEAGIPREDVYITNAVKHFAWTPSGNRRLHRKPSSREVKACRPWLIAELERVRPVAIICLGATAAHAVFGKAMRVGVNRGRAMESEWSAWTFITTHPSALLRMPDERQRAAAFDDLVRDLRLCLRSLVKSDAQLKRAG